MEFSEVRERIRGSSRTKSDVHHESSGAVTKTSRANIVLRGAGNSAQAVSSGYKRVN